MAQVGEFSFIIASDAFALELIDVDVYNLILGTAVVSILLTPIATQISERLAAAVERRIDQCPRPHRFRACDRCRARKAPRARRRRGPPVDRGARQRPGGPGRGPGGAKPGFRCVVIDRDPRKLEDVAKTGAVTMFGDAANPHILERRAGQGAC